jgi:hypothetical protein
VQEKQNLHSGMRTAGKSYKESRRDQNFFFDFRLKTIKGCQFDSLKEKNSENQGNHIMQWKWKWKRRNQNIEEGFVTARNRMHKQPTGMEILFGRSIIGSTNSGRIILIEKDNLLCHLICDMKSDQESIGINGEPDISDDANQESVL